MATNYPGSVDSYPTRSDGQPIDPSHTGNLQDAVVAIETALGTNPKGMATSVATRAARLEYPGWASGRWWIMSPAASAAKAPTLNTLYAAPVYVGGATIDQLGIVVTAIGTAASVRLGIYDTNPTTGFPNNLVGGSSAVSVSATGGVIATGLSIVVTPGWYWMAGVAQGTAAPTWEAVASSWQPLPLAWTTTPTSSSVSSGYVAVDASNATNTVTGALPSTFVAAPQTVPVRDSSAISPRMWLHAA